jgi:hypothetical protein
MNGGGGAEPGCTRVSRAPGYDADPACHALVKVERAWGKEVPEYVWTKDFGTIGAMRGEEFRKGGDGQAANKFRGVVGDQQ